MHTHKNWLTSMTLVMLEKSGKMLIVRVATCNRLFRKAKQANEPMAHGIGTLWAIHFYEKFGSLG